MGFKSFTIGIIIRVILIVVVAYVGVFFFMKNQSMLQGILFSVIVLFLTFNLISFGNTTNRKITRFLESIRYSDFSSSFTKDSKLGRSFKEMNMSFNEVIDAFKKTRAEKEEQMLFLQIMIQHINTGILSFDNNGKIGVINGAAKQLLQIPQFKDINDLGKLSRELLRNVLQLKPGGSFSIKINSDLHLNVQSASFKMEGHSWTLLSFQNIKSELQKNELQAWQNLTRVLRHEIMNSMTPIASLANSLGTILEEDIQEKENGVLELEKETYLDLSEGLETISKRSVGLVDFVNAYRDYTNIPQPDLKRFSVHELFENICVLLKEELLLHDIKLIPKIQPSDLEIIADQSLVQMILINLIKNAKEAMSDAKNRTILLTAGTDNQSVPYIQVTDHGEGIVPEAIERIFVPFFTTKKTGSGIGLAISRQIMNMHKGSLDVESVVGEKSVFTLRFG
ncbi:Histidine kinase-, DNA gyrase B-, and HSP90-like ATPase [Aquiflexum balticum DSM 16537]|uniref:histidine kinase n=1 Tax=Aquiflexum balticum DSM 16537 TaxID=758820 RepID=A0A1W2H900_9BACT|nr:ATP-binding protein [Aquiflexum balticum]SMD45351.1 Histidine kinase-, DNA gyrase B-, and HSP90-like ATPase [Aquiflexum balticum DSM 16537]